MSTMMIVNGHPATSTQEAADRRKSGRSIRKPDLFAEEHYESSQLNTGSTKRKRPTNGHVRDDDDEADGDTEKDAESEPSEDEPDEEEFKEKRRALRKKTDKPATKRPRTSTGRSTTLAIRSANVPKRPGLKLQRQHARARPSQAHQEGLYAEVFGHDESGEEAAAEWLKSFERDNVAALTALINFILKCTGCDQQVENQDIEDVDNVASKLTDMVDEYRETGVTEYPLVSKLKPYVGFQTVLVEFMIALIKSLHTSATLYDDVAVYENIHTWVATMSGAAFRPVRHTATVISLAMSTALCEIAHELEGSIATTRAQIESERKKKSVNKGRVRTMEDGMKADERKLETIDSLLKDAFDTVFVHRYRDIEEKLRVECVAALGHWISLYRTMFLDGQYLRYFGWLLSDTAVATRLEVVKQLKALYKSQKNIAALRAFTDRFRARLVEVGERDADPGVRAEAIDLLDRLRNAELLEPNDIDKIGKLIFDSEFRVRKAVAKFFVSNIEDLYTASTEELDTEQYEAALPKAENNEDYLQPTQNWIKYKCLAQTLTGYDDQDEPAEHRASHKDLQSMENMDSRYMLATQSIYPHMKELRDWEGLAGYLLYDHSQISTESDDAEVAQAVQVAYKLENSEDIALLDVLYCAVKLYLLQIIDSQGEKKTKRSQATQKEIQEKQAAAAHSLTSIIPQLLNKFGSIPHAAASILRLEQLLNIDLIHDLQQGDATTTSLLEDINKQFMTHSDPKVLTEASKAFREARKYEQSKEAADAKVQEIWDDAASTLQNLLQGQNVDTRGALSSNVLSEVSNTVSRLASLASISDCSAILESQLPPPTGKKIKGKAVKSSVLDLLFDLLKRGVPDDISTHQFNLLEDDLCLSVIKTIQFYFLWRAQRLRTALTSDEFHADSLVSLPRQRDTFVENLTPIIQQRTPLDPIRVQALSTILDIFTLFSTLRHIKPGKDAAASEDLSCLTTPLPTALQTCTLQTHSRLETAFARRTRRKLDPAPRAEVDDNASPVDSDDEQDNDPEHDDGDDDDEGGEEVVSRKEAALIAEQRLCEFTSKIVLAVIGHVFKAQEGVRAQLARNRAKLGRNYQQVLGYLDDKGRGGKKAGKQVKGTEKGKEKDSEVKQKPVIVPMALEGDDIVDGDEEDEDGHEQEREDSEGDEDIDQDRTAEEDDERHQPGPEPEEIMGD